MDAINRLVAYFGGSIRSAATALGVTRSTIHHWARYGVSDDWACRIQLLTRGRITRHRLRPDLAPLPYLTPIKATKLPRGPKSPLLYQPREKRA